MGLRVRKTVKLTDLLQLNFSKSGVSITFGVPGLNTNINLNGKVSATVGLPGTGISYKETLVKGSRKKK